MVDWMRSSISHAPPEAAALPDLPEDPQAAIATAQLTAASTSAIASAIARRHRAGAAGIRCASEGWLVGHPLSATMRILVVEDHPRLATAVAEGSRREGMAVDLAFDGAEALARVAVNRSRLRRVPSAWHVA